jgi:hypothetical protein
MNPFKIPAPPPQTPARLHRDISAVVRFDDLVGNEAVLHNGGQFFISTHEVPLLYRDLYQKSNGRCYFCCGVSQVMVALTPTLVLIFGAKAGSLH